MEKVRRVSLRFYEDGDENKTGQVISLNSGKDFGMVTDLQGLGFSLAASYSQIGNRFVLNDKKINQDPISFNIYLKTYKRYKELADYIKGADYKVTLHYDIELDGTVKDFRRDMLISNVGKTEKVNKYLCIPIQLVPLSFWYDYKVDARLSISNSDEYIQYEFDNDSDFDCEIQFKVYGGSFNNFEFKIVSSNDEFAEKIYQMKNITISSSEVLEYSSKDNEFYIRKVLTSAGNTQITDLLKSEYLDFNNENILKVPARKNSILMFKASNISNKLNVVLETKKFWVSV